jgi:hypothetical protein
MTGGDRHPVLAIAVLTTFVGPLVFIGWFEHNRRKSKRAREDNHRTIIPKRHKDARASRVQYCLRPQVALGCGRDRRRLFRETWALIAPTHDMEGSDA